MENQTQPAPTTKQPTIGRIVHYVLETPEDEVHERPAIIVHVWSPQCVQLQVFTDGDGGKYNDHLPNVVWRTSVIYEPVVKASGTWHWPEE